MPYCCVPHCTSGDPAKDREREASNLPKLHFLSLPKDKEVRAQWEANIKRKGGLKDNFRVCSEHFTTEQMDLFWITTLKDGTVSIIPKERGKLKPGAVPTEFNYPEMFKPKKRRKSPTDRKPLPPKDRTKKQLDTSIDETLPDAGESLSTPETEKVCEVNEEEIERNFPGVGLNGAEETKWSHMKVHQLHLPLGWVVLNTTDKTHKTLVEINNDSLTVEKAITFQDDSVSSVKVRGIEYPMNDLPSKIESTTGAQDIICQVQKLHLCAGTGIKGKKYSVDCSGALSGRALKCKACRAERDRQMKMQSRLEKIEKRAKVKKAKTKSQVQSLRRTKAKLIMKIQHYKRVIAEAISECGKRDEDVLNKAISKLPETQQEAVRACFNASKKRGPSGRRYTVEWLYECMLMRIKDRKLYNHIREHDILPLPCLSTINGYIKNFSGTYGFQPQTFQMIKAKTVDMEKKNRRGILLIDEMKLTPGTYFDQSTLKVVGFKDMGEDKYEALGEEFADKVDEALESLPPDPQAAQKAKRKQKQAEKHKNSRDKNLGDHALVISFQPFRGKWVQAIACFLTRGAANDEELTKLILEAVILLEGSGLFVDGVVTDGAAWNRSMWKKFGITVDEPSAQHPCDSERKLWFFSDFPHLLKCMRNCFCEHKLIQTPEGDIKHEHWQAVLDAELLRKIGVRECHNLTQDHLHPSPFQKMNVRMAWQFWSASVSAAMKSYRLQGVEELDDCEASAKFCQSVNHLADVMNSNRPNNALRLGSEDFKLIGTFRDDLIALMNLATEKKRKVLEKAEAARVQFLKSKGKTFRSKSSQELEKQAQAYVFSESTDLGLLVSLKATQEITEFLINQCGYTFVMTARLNQDALERFFGLVRQSCGANTHPEPRVFAQLFRLLSIYSLVKPIKGSNITGGEMLTTLLNLKDLRNKTGEERKRDLSERLDEIVLNGENLDLIPEIMEHIDHEYLGEPVDEFALSYIGATLFKKSHL